MDTSDWSDPTEPAISASPAANGHDSSGIAIPAFLQPLLGLDFVPYLPRTVATSAASSDVTRLTDDELEELDLLGPASERLSSAGQLSDHIGRPSSSHEKRSAVKRSKSLEARTSDPGFSDALKPPAIGEPSQEDAASSVNGNRKSPWRPRGGRLMSKVRGKMEERREDRRVRKERRQSRTGTPPLESQGRKYNSEALDWIQEQNLRLANHQSHLEEVHLEAQEVKTRANEIYQRFGEAQSEILKLQKALVLTEHRLRRDLKELDDTKGHLNRLQMDAMRASQAIVDSIQQMQVASSSNSDSSGPTEEDCAGELIAGTDSSVDVSSALNSPQPLRRRASTAPSATRVDSFMRVDDLDIEETEEGNDELAAKGASTHSSSSSSIKALPKRNGLIFVDSNITPILQNLSKLGYQIAVDESNRFSPTRDTERLLAKYATISWTDNRLDEWPIAPWKAAHGLDILVWTGDIGHNGFGSDWPVVKARCLVETSPRSLIEFMMDSSRIKEYNKMSQGRDDLVRIQQGLDTSEEESIYGFSGDCKIVRALNKPRLLPKTIETMSLTHSQPLAAAPGSYMTVTRSVFEDSSGAHKSSLANTIRSEMLLGVNIFRPANADHTVTEFTSITHIFSPGVPEMLARRAAPASAYNVMKDVQSVFLKRK